MRTRIAAAALAAAALLALTACSSNDDDKAATPTTPTVDVSSAAAGIPPKPNAEQQRLLLAAVESVDPGLAADPDKTVMAARNQCQALSGGAANPDHLAAERFGNDAHPLSDAQGKALNVALQATLCPQKG